MDPDDATAHRSSHALERIAATLRLALLLAILGVVLWLFADVLLLIFAASLLALGLRGGAGWISRVADSQLLHRWRSRCCFWWCCWAWPPGGPARAWSQKGHSSSSSWWSSGVSCAI